MKYANLVTPLKKKCFWKSELFGVKIKIYPKNNEVYSHDLKEIDTLLDGYYLDNLTGSITSRFGEVK